jgi:mono/diheme cytochrome c family protein
VTGSRPTPRPLDTPELERALDRYYLVGLVCMAALIIAFPIYKLGEPARRARTLEAMQAENITIGKTMFAQHCAACHGDEARGGRGFPTLGAREFLESVTDRQLHWLVAGGIPGSAMVAYDLDLGGPFTAQEIARVVSYLRSLEEEAPSVSGWYRGELAPPRELPSRATPPGDAVAQADTESAPAPAAVAAVPGLPADTAEQRAVATAEVERVYASRCAACHGAAGEGTPIAPAVRPLAAMLAANPDSVYAIVARGVAGTAMMPFAVERGGQLEATTIRSLVAWMRAAPRDP